MNMINDNHYPKPKIKDSVKITHPKVNDGRERFWVTIERILNDECQGIVDNELVDKSNYDYGSKIYFKISDVLSIYPHVEAVT